MRIVLKIVAWVLGLLVLLVLVAMAAVYAVSNSRTGKHFTVQVQAVPVPSGAAAIGEGQRLFLTRGCTDCHDADLAGKEFVNDPLAGRFTGANLTRGRGGAAATFTDADFVRAIRHGVAPDGRALLMMPSTDFNRMNDADVGLLIAYIRSAAPVDRTSPPPRPGPLMRVLYLLGQNPLLVTAEVIDHSLPPSASAPAAVSVEYGHYVAAGCTGCHGPGLSGGAIPGAPPDWPLAMNITQDTATGIGKWSEEQFETAVRKGKRPDGTAIRFPMPWQNFSKMTDTEIKALWAYLRTVPAKPFGNH